MGTSEDRGIHGKVVGPQMRVNKVDGKDEGGGEQGLFTVNDLNGIQGPAGEELPEEGAEPHDVAG